MSAFPCNEITQGALIERLAAELPERDALVYPDRDLRLSFAELEARSLAIARGLIAIGIEPGERVTVWADNRPDWIPCQFALARIGAVMVTANTALTQPEIRYLLEQSRSAAVIAAPGRGATEYFDALSALVGEEGALPELREWIGMEGSPPAPARTLDAMIESGRAIAPEEVARRTAATTVDDATNIQYTSGTTGFPKGVVLTHRNIVENAFAVSRLIQVTEADRMLLQVPLFHCFGCAISVLGAYTHGIPLITTQGFDPLASLRAISAERVSVVHGVPTMFLAMLSHPEFESYRPSSLRAGIMAGTMCPEPLMRRVIAEMGCEGMLVAYGMTEASPGITCSRPEDPVEVRCGTVGRALDGVEVRIADPDTGARLANGTRGEIWCRGPNVMQGYFEKAEETAAAIVEGGWLRTGDLGTMDDDGLVRIVGRIKELIIRGGENVYPGEVEDALRAHADVRDAAVFGLADERLGEEVAAAIVPEDSASPPTREALEHFLEERLASFKRPRHFAIVADLPVTPSGKVQKFRLAQHCGFTSAR